MNNDFGKRAAQFALRLAKPADVSAIHAIQEESYSPSMQEQQDVILCRLQQAPSTCWVAEDDAGVGAYLFAYLSRLGALTPLEGGFRIAPDADALYLHDLAVSSRMAGKGVGQSLFNRAMAFARAQRLAYSTLVSVQDSCSYWMKRGYVPGTPLPEYGEHLKGYPEDALYMIKSLDSD